MKKPVKHLFFDLDHTIWDFDRNAEETLLELYERYDLKAKGLSSAATFISKYTENNHKLWAEYHRGEITKAHLRAQRFHSTFTELGVHPDHIPAAFEDDYVTLSPTKTHLFDGAKKVLAYLRDRYQLHIISNGFKETTLMKMDLSGLNPYFTHVIISENVGVNKPNQAIFKHALELASARLSESVMIGDSLEADIYGAQQFGMNAIYFNPLQKEKPADVPHQIYHLEDLLDIF